MKYRGPDAVTCPFCDQLFFRLDDENQARARVRCRRCRSDFIVRAEGDDRTYLMFFDSAVRLLTSQNLFDRYEAESVVTQMATQKTADGIAMVDWQQFSTQTDIRLPEMAHQR